MSVAFTLMTEDPLARVTVGARVSPGLAEKLEAFGARLRELNATNQKGTSAAIALVLEMADGAGWFDNPEKFAVELLKARTAAVEKIRRKP